MHCGNQLFPSEYQERPGLLRYTSATEHIPWTFFLVIRDESDVHRGVKITEDLTTRVTLHAPWKT